MSNKRLTAQMQEVLYNAHDKEEQTNAKRNNSKDAEERKTTGGVAGAFPPKNRNKRLNT